MSTLPTPNLDDRNFQDLVDDAKRRLATLCPEWTDHNVSDPGVTLIETFAWMVEGLGYRLNRVPDRLYVTFLELIGVRLFPATAARADVTFWLTAPQPEPVLIPAGTEVATTRTESTAAVGFSTSTDLAILPCSIGKLAASWGGEIRHQHETLAGRGGFDCFAQVPRPDDALLVGLSDSVGSCAVALRLRIAKTAGAGVDPGNPPIRWEAWTGTTWTPCEIDRDETGGLNQSGEVIVHVPPDHQPSVLDGQRAAWLRCRVVTARPGQPPFSASPRIDGIEAFTIGGTVAAVQAETVHAEHLGASEGLPGQRFQLRHAPAIDEDEPIIVESVGPAGRGEWTTVPNLAASGPRDRHVVVDHVTGEVSFGPVVRQPDGGMRYYGAVPAKGDALLVRHYRCGGGRRGNVARGAINVLKTSIPLIKSVTNRRPATGGVDAENIDEAKVRGPLALRSRDRAVTAADYEHLARQATHSVARVRCATGQNERGLVRVLVVPAATDDAGKLAFEQLRPPEAMLATIAAYLDERRVVGTRLVVEPPRYRGVTIVARLRGRSGVDEAALQRDALTALYGYLHPLRGGPDGTGWPFGRAVDIGEVYAVFHRLAGIDRVEQVQLFPANPRTGERENPVTHLELAAHELVFSFEHQIRVRAT